MVLLTVRLHRNHSTRVFVVNTSPYSAAIPNRAERSIPLAATWIRSAAAIGLACSFAATLRGYLAPTTTWKATSVIHSAAYSAPLTRRGKRVASCSALAHRRLPGEMAFA